MKIKAGLFDHMVLQRGADNKCDAEITGAGASDGTLNATVARRGRALPGCNARVIGRVRRGRLTGRLRGVPAGGPYEVRLTVKDDAGRALDEVLVRDVLVGDVWMLAGQSNMEGVGRLCDAERPHPQVRALFMNDEWGMARDPIHVLSESVDTVHSGWADPDLPRPRAKAGRAYGVGVGPGLAFAKDLQARTGVPQGLLACAHGGTSMEAWCPTKRRLGSRSLYGAMLRRFRKSGGRVAGMVWYQGESDANAAAAAKYTARMKKLVAAVRRDFHDARLPWATVQLATVYNRANELAPFWNQIQEQQRRLPAAIRHLATVPAIDLALDDTIHVAGREMARLGRRLAGAMRKLRRDRNAGAPPIELHSVGFELDKQYNCCHVVVRFKNVIGQLRAAGRPSGFSLTDALGTEYASRTELRGDKAVLRTSTLNPGMFLQYGRGTTPYCNVTDAADRSLPVFGPLIFDTSAIKRKILRGVKQLRTGIVGGGGFADRALVSRPLPAPADIRKLSFPVDLKELGMKPRTFPAGFWDLHRDVFNCAPRDLMVYFTCRLVCARAMKLRLGVGYDGPIKIWADKREIFRDPKGTNPADVDKALIPFDASQGEHTLVFAMTSNQGRAWGIKFRCHPRLSPGQQTRPGAKAVLPKVRV